MPHSPRSYRLFLACAFCLFGISAARADSPLKVYILAGQSNMQGHAHIRTFAHIGMDPETAPLLDAMTDDDGTPSVCENVWITSIGSADQEKTGKLTAGFGAEKNGPKIGPEFTFGIYMQRLVDEPILIIKTAWGGKSLHTDFRPPSAGPYVFNENQLANFRKQNKDIDQIKAERKEATGHYYRLMTDHVKTVLADIKRVKPDYDEKLGYELAGFVWFQGWNDMVDRGVYPTRDQPGGYDDYSKVLTHFIRDVRKDLDAPELPFVIGVMGAGGPVAKYGDGQKRYASVHQNFRDAMAAPARLPEFRGNVIAVPTEECWDMEVTALRQREAKIKQEIKRLENEGKWSRQELATKQKQMRGEEFDERELKILETAVSNFEFHYLGCAKIFAKIGKRFAEATHELARQAD